MDQHQTPCWLWITCMVCIYEATANNQLTINPKGRKMLSLESWSVSIIVFQDFRVNNQGQPKRPVRASCGWEDSSSAKRARINHVFTLTMFMSGVLDLDYSVCRLLSLTTVKIPIQPNRYPHKNTMQLLMSATKRDSLSAHPPAVQHLLGSAIQQTYS